MNPEARHDVELHSERLSPLALAVWIESDGTRRVAELAERVSVSRGRPVPVDEVFAALDELGDAGLLVERVTPPGTPSLISRRNMLKASLAGAGLVAAGATPVAAAGRKKKRKDPQENNRKARKGGQEDKQKNRKGNQEDRKKDRKNKESRDPAEDNRKSAKNAQENQKKQNRGSSENARKEAKAKNNP